MTWQYPWVISGVTETPLDVARVLAYAATGGNEGVVGPADLQVKALGVPGASVNVLPGAAVCLNRFSLGSSQSYVANNVGNDNIAIGATGGGQRVDMVYVAIIDPGQPGNPTTASVAQTRVIQNVSPSAKKLSDVPGYTNVSGLALALITIPASTATITDAMITDLRYLVTSKSDRDVYFRTPTSTTTTSTTTTNVWTQFPLASQIVTVPTWATVARVFAFINGLQYSGQIYGYFRLKFDTQVGTAVIYDLSTPTSDPSRFNMMVGGSFSIPAALRGTNVTISTEVMRVAGAGTANSGSSNTAYDVQFDQGVTVS